MNVPKTVCILKHRLGQIGGLEKSTWRIAQAFAKKGCLVTIVSSDLIEDTSFLSPLIHFVHLPCKQKLSAARIQEFDKKARHYLLNKSYDIVFGMDRNRNQTHLRLGNGIHKVFLQTRRHTDSLFKRMITPFNPLHRLILSIEKQSLESPSLKCLFTNSHMVKNQLLEHYKVDPQKIHVIHNGVEWEELEKDYELWIEKKPKIAKSLDVDPTIYHFLFIGNGYKRKGLDVLLKALSILKNEEFHLSVVGKDRTITEYILKAKNLGLEDKVSFHGQQKEIKKFYQLCDTLVIPSFYDPFANVTVEALAMGLYVISSSFNGGSEVLSDFNGKIIETLLDPACLAKALKEVLAYPKTWMRSKRIRESVKHLDFSQQTATLVETSLNYC